MLRSVDSDDIPVELVLSGAADFEAQALFSLARASRRAIANFIEKRVWGYRSIDKTSTGQGFEPTILPNSFRLAIVPEWLVKSLNSSR